MGLSQFDFDSRYEKGLINTQAYALSCLYLLEKTITLVDADIPTYPLRFDQLDAVSNDLDGMDDLDDALAVTTNTTPSFVSVTLDELHLSQSGENFCRTIQASLGKGERVSLVLNENNVLFRSVDGFEQVAILQSIVPRVLHLSYHAKMTRHSG